MFRIVPPDMGKGPMIAFDAITEDEAWSANAAIRHTFARWQPFHQVGTTPDGANLPGYHAWELWQPITDDDARTTLAECEQWYGKVRA